MIREYFLVKKETCSTVADILVELSGIYSFHPVLKDARLPETIYEYYWAKLISSSEGVEGIMYYIDDVSSDDKYNQLICSVVKTRKTQGLWHSW